MARGSIAKPGSMLNVAIFDPRQRSLFSRLPGIHSADNALIGARLQVENDRVNLDDSTY